MMKLDTLCTSGLDKIRESTAIEWRSGNVEWIDVEMIDR
jgi:hypothetical protein